MSTPLQNPYQQNPVDYLSRIAALFRDYKGRALEFLQPAPGEHLLDVGCGAGDDLLSLASMGLERVKLTGVDPDIKSLEAARERAEQAGVTIDFREGDLSSLPLEDHSVDVSRCDRVFQHLADPDDALRELIRVTRPGGRVVVVDVDWGTLVMDHPFPDQTDRIVGRIRDRHVNGRAGRRLAGAFQRAGLQRIDAYADAVCVRDWEVAVFIWALKDAVCRIVEEGFLEQEEADVWWAEAESAAQAGTFSGSMTGFVVRGWVPAE